MSPAVQHGPHGILVVDKPAGVTSHDIVASARRHFGTRRVGHAGTLDPMATGVLVLLFGEATKLSDVATTADKSYRAELCLGRSTDSHDADGHTTDEQPVTWEQIDSSALPAALTAERERRWQVPPAVSAIKLAGQRAYRLARGGAPPELEPRAVRVHSLSIVARGTQRLTFELCVSKGYYVRALARDLGTALGVPAHLSQLRRLSSGCFTLWEACSWPPPGGATMLSLESVLPRLLPILRLNDTGVRRARAGQALRSTDFLDDADSDSAMATEQTTLCAWTDSVGAPVALGQREAEVFRVRRGFAANLMNSSTTGRPTAGECGGISGA